MSQGVQRTGLIIAGVFIWLTQSAIAHHSFAMYDMTKSQSMTGKLTRFIPGGNHAQLVFEVLGDDGKPLMKDGKPVIWGVETGSAAAIARNAAGIVAVELIAAAQGVDYHAPLKTSEKLRALHARVRVISPHLDRDRYWADEMAALQSAVLKGDVAPPFSI